MTRIPNCRRQIILTALVLASVLAPLEQAAAQNTLPIPVIALWREAGEGPGKVEINFVPLCDDVKAVEITQVLGIAHGGYRLQADGFHVDLLDRDVLRIDLAVANHPSRAAQPYPPR